MVVPGVLPVSAGAGRGQILPAFLRCEYRVDPLGIDVVQPRLSWICIAQDQSLRSLSQSGWQVLVSSSAELLAKDNGDLWDSGKVKSDRSNQIVYNGKPLASRTRCYWKVRVWDQNEGVSDWSEPALWTMGLLRPEDWSAHWIGYQGNIDTNAGSTGENRADVPPVPYLRHEFACEKPVKRATLYASALGLFEMSLNGKRVGKDYFTPGDVDFRKRTYYLTYDVSDVIRQGSNAWGVLLGEGWYASYLAFSGRREWYGGKPCFLGQLVIEYEDGTRQTIGTDKEWKAAYGVILDADMLMGYTADNCREPAGWDRPDYDDKSWQPVTVDTGVVKTVTAKPDEPVRAFEEIAPKTIQEIKPGTWVVDFGQNMVGWVKLNVTGKAGQKIVVRHAEMLNPDGTIYTTNLRAAKCIDTYYLKGEGHEVLEPKFTFHGFQYVEITGLETIPAKDSLRGIVVHSALPRTGYFSCSNPLLNQLFHNIIWGQKGNYLEIPTDCPQRDERAGWTGDAQFFMPTAIYNFDVSAFFTKWLVDLIEDGQRPDGSFPDVAPDLNLGSGNTAWGDAAVICTYYLYKAYDDTRVLEKYFDAFGRWMELQQKTSSDYVRGQGQYGDWLNLGGGAKPEVVGTAYFAYTARLMAEMAAAINRTNDAKRYTALADSVKESFIRHFVKADGSILDSSQTGYAIAFTMDLLPESNKTAAAELFVQDIKSRDWHLATGFIGTPRLLPALHEAGRDDVACKLLLQETYPSWLFQVKLGASTMWERWDGWTPEKGFQDPGMNSFNHYAFGSVGEYLYGMVGGISALEPGYRKILIRPVIEAGISAAEASYDSIRGRIACRWEREGGMLTMNITIPANTTARVYIPAKDPAAVTESGKSAAAAPGVALAGEEHGAVVFEVGSGTYSFSSKQ